jgi:hypothetical protein
MLMLTCPCSAWFRTKIAAAIFAIGAASMLVGNSASEAFAQSKAKPKPVAQAVDEPDLATDLDEAIRIVEAGEFKKFLERYAPVELLRKMRQEDVVDQAATMLAQQPKGKAQLLAVLKALKKQTPRYDKSRGLATLEFDPQASGVPEAPIELKLPATGELKLVGLGDDVAKTIVEATKLLEKGEIGTFVERLFPATEIARLAQNDQMAALLQQLKDNPEMKTALLADLKRMQATKAELTEKGQVAVFKLAASKELPARTVKMQKTGDHWRLYDDGPRVAAELTRQSKLKPQSSVMNVQMELIGGNWRFVELPLFRDF